MLGTIKLPRNMKLIGNTLPESNYDSDKDSKAPQSQSTVSANRPKYRPQLQASPVNRFIPGTQLDEIKEVSELDNVLQTQINRKHKKPKVLNNYDVFLEESPRPVGNRVPINKVIPSQQQSNNYTPGTGRPHYLNNDEDPMIALQKRMMDKRSNDKIKASIERRDDDYNEIKIMPMKKKVHSKNPGSSPEQRSGIEGIDYVYKHGKAPLIEKRDIKLRQVADIYGAEQGALLPTTNKKSKPPRLERGGNAGM